MQYCRSHVKHLVLAVLTVFRENWNMQLASLLSYISKDLKPFPRTLFSSLLLLHPFVCIFSFIIAYMLPKNWNRKQKKKATTNFPAFSFLNWLTNDLFFWGRIWFLQGWPWTYCGAEFKWPCISGSLSPPPKHYDYKRVLLCLILCSSADWTQALCTLPSKLLVHP